MSRYYGNPPKKRPAEKRQVFHATPSSKRITDCENTTRFLLGRCSAKLPAPTANMHERRTKLVCWRGFSVKFWAIRGKRTRLPRLHHRSRVNEVQIVGELRSGQVGDLVEDAGAFVVGPEPVLAGGAG